MDRIRRLAFFVFFVSFLQLSGFAGATLPSSIKLSQGEAFSACNAEATARAHPPSYSCIVSPTSLSNNSSCPGGAYMGRYDEMDSNGVGPYASWFWCVPATCDAHDSGSPSQQWSGVYQNGIVYCNDSCMSVFHFETGIGSLQFQNGDGASWGHFVGNGNRCASNIDASLFKTPPPAKPLCDHGGLSCFNHDRGFCATTDSGEQICEPAPPPGSGGCAAGATGATCVGNNAPPPVPPDPPIQKDQPPNSSSSATGIDSGGTTNNYTTNNYSGTSDGGGSGSSGAPSSSPDSGGSQSNANGAGNSGKNGTDSTGKCSNGSAPTASGCSGTYTDNGCDTPPACFGDAVMCGQAREMHAVKCNTAKIAASASSSRANYGDPSAALAAAGVPSDGGASSDPSTSGLVSISDLGSDGFDTSGLGFSRTCPANPQFSVFGRTFTLDLTPFCNFASLLGWFVLLVAFLAGLRIVATGKG